MIEVTPRRELEQVEDASLDLDETDHEHSPLEDPLVWAGAVEPGDAVDGKGQFLRKMGRVSLLTAEQEVELAKRIELGDSDARNQMIESNLRLVVNIAGSFPEVGGLTRDDLIQAGTIGLMKAVEKFDHQMGYKLSTYATWWITQAVQRELQNNSRTIRFPVHIIERHSKAQAAARILQVRLGREASEQEIAEEAGLSEEHMKSITNLPDVGVSLDTPPNFNNNSGGELRLGDFIADSSQATIIDQVATTISNDKLYCSIEKLEPIERRVIKLRYGLADEQQLTLAQASRQLGITRQAVRKLERKAHIKLSRMDAEFEEIIQSLDATESAYVAHYNGLSGKKALSVSGIAGHYKQTESEVLAILDFAYMKMGTMAEEMGHDPDKLMLKTPRLSLPKREVPQLNPSPAKRYKVEMPKRLTPAEVAEAVGAGERVTAHLIPNELLQGDIDNFIIPGSEEALGDEF